MIRTLSLFFALVFFVGCSQEKPNPLKTAETFELQSAVEVWKENRAEVATTPAQKDALDKLISAAEEELESRR